MQPSLFRIPILHTERIHDCMELRIMTYNILHGMEYALWQTEKRAVIDLPKTADTIRKVGADICALNEVRGAGLTPEYTAQADALGSHLGFYHVFGRSIYVGGTEPYGNGLVSRYPIATAEVIPIPDPVVDGKVPSGVESRSILRCTFDFAGDKHLTVLATHFGLSLPERENAAVLCWKRMKEEKNPTILLGDFNSTPDDAVLQQLRREYRSVGDFRRCTFPTDSPHVRIDYIFFNEKVVLRRHGIGPHSASDHLPVWADVQI